MSQYATSHDYVDLARAMGWHMSIGVNICLTKPGRRSIMVHHHTDVSYVRALIKAAEADQMAVTS